MFSRFSRFSKEEELDPYKTYDDTDDDKPSQPSASSTPSTPKHPPPPTFTPTTQHPPPPTFTPTPVTFGKAKKQRTFASAPLGVISTPIRHTSAREHAQRMLHENDHLSSLSSDSDLSDDEPPATIAARYTKRKRKLTTTTTSSSTAQPQAPDIERYTDALYDIIRETNFSSNTQFIQDTVKTAFSGHLKFFSNLRIFTSALQGAVTRSAGDVWKDPKQDSYSGLASLLTHAFLPLKGGQGATGDSSIIPFANFGRGTADRPEVRATTNREMPFLWSMLGDALKSGMNASTLSLEIDNNDRVLLKVKPEVMSHVMIKLRTALASRRIQLEYSVDASALFKDTAPPFDTPIVNRPFDPSEREAVLAFEAFIASGFKSTGIKLDSKEQDLFDDLLEAMYDQYGTFTESIITNLKTLQLGGTPVFEWLVFEEELKAPPVVHFLAEIRHLEQQEQEKRMLEKLGMSGNIKTDILRLLERLTNVKYFAAIRHAYDAVKQSGKSLYEIIDDVNGCQSTFADLCAAIYNRNVIASSSYSSDIRKTHADVDVGTAIDQFMSITTRARSSQTLRVINPYSFNEKTDQQVEEYLREAVMAAGAIL